MAGEDRTGKLGTRNPGWRWGFGRVIPTLLLLAAALIVVGCGEPASLSNTATRTPNPKLDSTLNGLVAATLSDNASEFAAQRSIELVNGRVRVIIECLPGQAQAVSASAGSLGTVEASHQDQLQLLAPVENLVVLAEDKNIRLIRLPLPSLPDGAK